ncbi:phospholipase B1, membrane-associated-like [Babylonia areolata]|uniref:phospholipase B1, membrane-associated-like n=1 Tax=Babylonia areolata TaxID=304850 RepID=UPI003FD4F15D
MGGRPRLVLLLCWVFLQWTDAENKGNRSNVASESNVFRCAVLPKSSPVPISVHELRPSDIKVVAALGDSITAGTGITAETIVEELIQNRGLSWSGGGQGTLEEHVTMPNILKKYNKYLYGYATGDGSESNVRAHLNLAAVGSRSSDLVEQAKALVSRMKQDDVVDFVNDWKLITILIGNNDLCDYCKDPDSYNQGHYYANLVRGLDVLHSELPRTLVSLVEPLNMQMVAKLNQGIVCAGLHYLVCECAAFPRTAGDVAKLGQLTGQYQSTVRELAASGRYDTRQDFTLVHQPFFNHTVLPMKDDKHPDLSYFAPDCFHLSAKGQAAAALALWNNMITPVQHKQNKWSPGDQLKCPSEDQPYIYTHYNSVPSATSSPATGSDPPYSLQMIVAISLGVGGVALAGSALFIIVFRRFRQRELYVQMPQ